MSNEPKYQLVGSVDVGAGATVTQHADERSEFSALVRQLITVQTRQNELLQEVVNQLSAAQRQRNAELAQWKQANPGLSKSCKVAADCLGKIQTEFLSNLAFEVGENFENMTESEYFLNEFFDKYGPRIVHLNTLLQTLSVLGNAPDVSKTVAK